MTKAKTSRAALESALAPQGLRLRGGWLPTRRDRVPMLPGGRGAAVVWMVGQVGSESWSAFKASPCFSDGQANPLDRWSQAIGDGLAAQHGGIALYPFGGPPWHPFQQWAARAEPLQTSPVMLQLHPKFGLWHAYRFALALPTLTAQDAAALHATPGPPPVDICRTCDGQPCLSACPVDAFTTSVYRVDVCTVHLHRPEGQDCMQQGCQARLACPVGADHRYGGEQAAFHMAAFARRR